MFKDTHLFQNVANAFLKNGFYCNHPWESPDWYDFWERELTRIRDGYEVNGVKITGEHYFYLNYCQIKKVSVNKYGVSKKIVSFPDFWDGDYNYFWVRKIAREGVLGALVNDDDEVKRILSLPHEEQLKVKRKLLDSLNLFVKFPDHALDGGFNLIVLKSRRKGYSYKSASVSVRNLILYPQSLTIFNAYEKNYLYPQGVFTMAKSFIDFLNKHTAFLVPSDVVNRQDHLRNSFIVYHNGIKVEQGYKSEIIALTANDNPDVNRGKDALDIFIEEAGAFGSPGLLQKLYYSSIDCVQSGAMKTGMITVYGTSGDMEGGSLDFADMFYRPEAFGFLPLYNIYEPGKEEELIGFFHPVSWNMEGFYDEHGNSDIEGATNYEKGERERLISVGASTTDIANRKQEKPLSPSEAFAITSTNIFPVEELRMQLAKVKSKNLFRKKGKPVRLIMDGDGNVKVDILDYDSVKPIKSYVNMPNDIKGVPIIYEYPVKNAPPNSYIIGYDPVRHDEGTSLGAVIVFKMHAPSSSTKDIIVAEYIGRPETAEDLDMIAMKFALLYNAKIMFENEIPSTKNFFQKMRKLNLLYTQPDAVISKHIKSSRVNRIYGCHITKTLKDAGERYIKDWLLEVSNYDEEGNPVKNLEYIYSPRLLEELIYYNRKGNFDMVSALIMVMIAREQYLISNYDEDKNKRKEIYKFFGSLLVGNAGTKSKINI